MPSREFLDDHSDTKFGSVLFFDMQISATTATKRQRPQGNKQNSCEKGKDYETRRAFRAIFGNLNFSLGT